MIDWKNDKRVQFAIGLAILIVGIKWLFTGTPFFALQDMRVNANSETPEPGFAFTAMTPVIIDIVVGLLIAVGAWAVNIVAMFTSKLQTPTAPPVAPFQGQAATQLASPAKTESDTRRDDVLNLARAAASNDLSTLEVLRVRIRRPQAIKELMAAYERGDITKASEITKELESLVSKDR